MSYGKAQAEPAAAVPALLALRVRWVVWLTYQQ